VLTRNTHQAQLTWNQSLKDPPSFFERRNPFLEALLPQVERFADPCP
jgi:hypothetical protein